MLIEFHQGACCVLANSTSTMHILRLEMRFAHYFAFRAALLYGCVSHRRITCRSWIICAKPRCGVVYCAMLVGRGEKRLGRDRRRPSIDIHNPPPPPCPPPDLLAASGLSLWDFLRSSFRLDDASSYTHARRCNWHRRFGQNKHTLCVR